MKILYLLDPATVGGATESFLSLMRNIQRYGVEPIVCTCHTDYLNEILNSYKIRNFAIHHQEMITTKISGRSPQAVKRRIQRTLRYVRADLRAIKIIANSVNMAEIDAIHTNSSRTDVGFYISMIYNKPHIVHLREFGDLDYNCYPINPLWKSIYKNNATKFICVSKAIQMHWVRKGLNLDKTCVIYNGINNNHVKISEDNTKRQSPMKLVIVGGVCENKGQQLAIEAIGQLPENIRDVVSLDIIGWYNETYKNQLERRAQALGVKEQVRFLGQKKDVLKRLADYHIGLMCSRAEGFGRVTAEYMFGQLGVIASNSGANPELISNNIDGLLFNSGDTTSLAEAIKYYFTNRDILIEHSKHAREKAGKMFTAELYAQNVYSIYKEVLKV